MSLAGIHSTVTPQNSDLKDIGKLLWTNTNPSYAFAEQTISLDLSKYRFIIVECANADYEDTLITRASTNENSVRKMWTNWTVTGTGVFVKIARSITVTPTGIVFSDCFVRQNGSSTATVTNTLNIPYHIYGIK